MSLNLHEMVGDVLTVVNDWQTLTFTRTNIQWVIESREPQRTTEIFELRGKIQPASLQELRDLPQFHLTEYQYFKVFVTGTPTQLDRIDQIGCDTFTVGKYTYKVVAKEPWDDAGWREIYAYKIDKQQNTESKNET